MVKFLFLIILLVSEQGFAETNPCMDWSQIGMENINEVVERENQHLVHDISGRYGIPTSKECWDKYNIMESYSESKTAEVYYSPVLVSDSLCKSHVRFLNYRGGNWNEVYSVTAVSISNEKSCKALKAKDFVFLKAPFEDITLINLLSQSSDILSQFYKKENIRIPNELIVNSVGIHGRSNGPNYYFLEFSNEENSSSLKVYVKYVGNDKYEYVNYFHIFP